MDRQALSHRIKGAFRRAAHRTARIGRGFGLAAEGLFHLGQASPGTKAAFEHDCGVCAVETGMALAEEASLEINIAVSSIEAAEELIGTPPEKINLPAFGASYLESVFFNNVSVLHAAAVVFGDLEKAGAESKKHRREARLFHSSGI